LASKIVKIVRLLSLAGGRIGSFASLGLCDGLCGLQMCQLRGGKEFQIFL